ncbi:MAG: hypothetical protein SFU25_00390 [Candidatus Caenarcaniphilales bacterium]|nr:hypothetical protein [Candidatus Caenarcaniphilales bacterium]
MKNTIKKNFWQFYKLTILLPLILLQLNCSISAATKSTKYDVVYNNEALSVSLIQMPPLADVSMNAGLEENQSGGGFFVKNKKGVVLKVYKLRLENKSESTLKLRGEILNRVLPTDAIGLINEVAKESVFQNKKMIDPVPVWGSQPSGLETNARVQIAQIPRAKQKMFNFIKQNISEQSPIMLTIPPKETLDIVYLADRKQNKTNPELAFKYSLNDSEEKTLFLNIEEQEALNYFNNLSNK